MKSSELKFRYWLFVPILLTVIPQLNCTRQTSAEEGRQVLEAAALAQGGLEALGAIDNITRIGTRQISSFGHGRLVSEALYVQPARPYNHTVDFTVPRELVLSDTGAVAQMVDSVKGGYRSSGRGALSPMEAARLERYRTEWEKDMAKFLVAALGEESSVEGVSDAVLEGQPHQVVSVGIGNVLYKVYVEDSGHFVSKLEFTEHHFRFGDLAKELIFSDYRDVDSVKLPFLEERRQMGLTTQVLEWSEVTINNELQEDLFQIPERIQERVSFLTQSDTMPVEPTKLAEGVYFGEGKGMNSMWVDFEEFILVVEGPNDEVQSLETIRQIRETVGEKPIRYLVTTHHHEDHNGGIRTYAASGVTLLTQAMNETWIWEMLNYPFTLKPDRLAESGVEPKVELVEDRRIIKDGNRSVELLHVPSTHAESFLVVYLPRERLIFESDLFSILQGQTGPPRVGPDAKILYDVVTQEGWRVNQIVPGHGRLVGWDEFVTALNASRSQTE